MHSQEADYPSDRRREKRVDRSVLRIIARWVAEHDRAPVVEPLVDRDFVVLHPARGAERLTK